MNICENYFFFTVNRNDNIPNFQELETTKNSYILFNKPFSLHIDAHAYYEYDEEESEEEEEKPVINTDQTFKSDECVIYITNSPNVLFCNCGHISICVECDKVKSLKICPVCKTENTIKKTIEY